MAESIGGLIVNSAGTDNAGTGIMLASVIGTLVADNFNNKQMSA